MRNTIKYILCLMTICITGLILTQFFWLYRDYRYYSSQPLLSTDYNFFLPAGVLRTVAVSPRIATLADAIDIQVDRNAPTIQVAKTNGVPSVAAYNAITGQTSMIPNPIIAYPTDWSPTTPTTPPSTAGLRITKRIAERLPSEIQLFQPIPYSAPVSYVLNKMKWQFGSSILLIMATAGCLVFMLIIIFRQRKVSAMKNDFINNMTHELKTPLATVSVAIEAMRNYGVLDDEVKTQSYLNISKNEIEHLSNLVEIILQQSIFEAEKMGIDKKDTDINMLLEQLINSYVTSNEQVIFSLSYKNNIPLLLLDPVHIINVIRNLINNSIKYSLENKIIKITSSYENECWTLKVTDNGIGIPKIYFKSVFEKFFRVPDRQTKSVKGFGLGLFYVKQVVELHKGEITLESSTAGSTFTIAIPFK